MTVDTSAPAKKASDSRTGKALLAWLGASWPSVEPVLGHNMPSDGLMAANVRGPRGGWKFFGHDMARLSHCAAVIGRTVFSFNELTLDEARTVQAAYLQAKR